ncbi:MAG TPA: UDP-N-acetylglucosamine 1-carboxyvinyltransferase [Verrucomicrobiota bacterium]|nr:UDP-N-acetylglucosamine 1-carboxyvinyltransferase [Verrucomicrobiales bacterium]HRI14391.1 UDP-N-acetylglucosamine 1-carboxyvinyltransferase [Verrucomicrobiota bacterium]
MDSFLIEGGVPLRGDVIIGGSKNAVLPILAAALLTKDPCTIRRVPDLSDVRFMLEILKSLGAETRFEDGTVTIRAAKVKGFGDYELIRKMRGSICILGPLLARFGQARVSLPGGCVIGTRPIDLHLKGLAALKTKIKIENGYIDARVRRLTGSTVFLGGRAGPTVLGTANVMMAASLAKGITVIESAACEPEVSDLAQCLVSMGARIHGIGSPTLTITGVEELHGTDYEVIPDRIEACTFICAAAATRGDVIIHGSRPEHFAAVLDKLIEAGVRIERKAGTLRVTRPGRLKPTDITTMPYAGFPTDVQAQFMALISLAPGTSVITERIFESRFMHVAELMRMGADVAIEGPNAIVKGGRGLSAAPVMASDLRASAALVIGGLAARGKTQVHRIYHLDRGYERMEEKLRGLGARISRVAGE